MVKEGGGPQAELAVEAVSYPLAVKYKLDNSLYKTCNCVKHIAQPVSNSDVLYCY